MTNNQEKRIDVRRLIMQQAQRLNKATLWDQSDEEHVGGLPIDVLVNDIDRVYQSTDTGHTGYCLECEAWAKKAQDARLSARRELAGELRAWLLDATSYPYAGALGEQHRKGTLAVLTKLAELCPEDAKIRLELEGGK